MLSNPMTSALLIVLYSDITSGEEACRDYLDCPEATDPENRRALSNIWSEVDMTEDTDWRQTEPDVEFFAVISKFQII